MTILDLFKSNYTSPQYYINTIFQKKINDLITGTYMAITTTDNNSNVSTGKWHPGGIIEINMTTIKAGTITFPVPFGCKIITGWLVAYGADSDDTYTLSIGGTDILVLTRGGNTVVSYPTTLDVMNAKNTAPAGTVITLTISADDADDGVLFIQTAPIAAETA